MIKIVTLTQIPMPHERRTARAVYRIYDADDLLLYVGMSIQPSQRIHDHSVKEWFVSADKVKICWHKTKESALNAEAISIITGKPKFNKAYSLNRVIDVFLPIVSVKILRVGKPKAKSLGLQDMKGTPMIYTVDELKKIIPNQIADAARFCGMSYSTMWRIFNDNQDPKESTLIALTKYVEKFNEPL